MTQLKETVLAMINNGGTEEDLEAVIAHIDNTFLEKEKEQIKNAWDKRGSTIVPRYYLEENINGEQYYNETYNK